MPRLYKKEKLCNKIAIAALFARKEGVESALSFPLRAVWQPNGQRYSDAPVQFLISIPKKRLRHAVDRVLMRRRVREAYRLLRDQYPLPEGRRIDIAFIYVDSKLQPYAKVEKAMRKLLSAVAELGPQAHNARATVADCQTKNEQHEADCQTEEGQQAAD